jgi:hypothetical protein
LEDVVDFKGIGPADVTAHQERQELEQARALAQQVAQQIAQAYPELEPGQELSVAVQGVWPDDVVIRAADLLGEAGWEQVDLRRDRLGQSVLGLLRNPKHDK